MSYETEYVAATIAALTAENEALRARLDTVEAETRERCAKVADVDEAFSAVARAIRNLEPRHD